MRIGLAAVVEGIKVCHGACGQHPFKLAGEHIPSGGAYGEKALPLAQHEPVHVELGAHQLGEHIGLEQLQRIGVLMVSSRNTAQCRSGSCCGAWRTPDNKPANFPARPSAGGRWCCFYPCGFMAAL